MEGRSLPTSAANHREKEPRHWMEEMRGSLMVVATVIATLTFQIAINPPGGVWQSDTDTQQGCGPGHICKAGTSVLAFGGDSNQKLKYEIFILLCTISFSASQTVILLLLCGIPLRNRLLMWLLIIVMCISVICLAGAYVVSIWMVMHPLDGTLNRLALYYAAFWVVLVVLLCLILFCRLMYWLLKKFFRLLCCY
ncbi:uncharacterized protein LOC133304256 [Gastrolobium bilobum]|uniref:uncharacterized protein LOC133304256 n=1 Tax=Gastrolobium bilobum TaxID=150636 RepID=UPI002AB05DC9|nr:uncharacterized protein LOC133304256 [Gastrolobium bilobum]